MALDDRDGYTERKREAVYNLLCPVWNTSNLYRLPDAAIEGLELVNVGPYSGLHPWTRCYPNWPKR